MIYEDTINKRKFEFLTGNDILWKLLFLRTKSVNTVSCSSILVIIKERDVRV
jgi:hypothetical protein